MSMGMMYFENAEEIFNFLDFNDFINKYKIKIYEKFEIAYIEARSSSSPDVSFVNSLLPLISGIIQVGATTDGFRAALQYIKKLFPEADYGLVIAKAVLAHIVSKRIEELSQPDNKEKEKKSMWEDMRNWLGRLA